MTNEHVLAALGQLEDDLILTALETPVQPRRTPWRTAAIVAACFCLAVLPAIAFTKQLWVERRHDGWEVNSPDARVEISAFSAQVHDVVAALEPGTHAFIALDDMAAVEDYLGVDMPDNAVLAGARPVLADVTDAYGTAHKTHCLVTLSKNVNGIFGAASVRAYYSYWGMDVDLFCQLVTTANPYVNGGGFAWGGYEDAPVYSEAYTTAAGQEAQLFVVDESLPGAEVQHFVGHGYITAGDVLIELTVRGHYQDLVTDTMKEIFDAY